MKFRTSIRALTVTGITAVISGSMLTGVAGAGTYQITPDIVYYCEANVCVAPTGSANNPNALFHADEYEFYGHYELKTPNGKSYNDADGYKKVGTNNNVEISGHNSGPGEYCGIAWESTGDGGYESIGDACFGTPGTLTTKS
jgi:hypothetical protein